MYERLLITGGAGFVGSALAVSLKQRFPSCRITALDNLHRRGSELNLPKLAQAGVRFLHGDVRAPEDLKSLGEAPDLIIECSAEPSAQAGYTGSPEYLIQSNLLGCFHCLELARSTRADFMFVSTSRVYPFGSLNALGFEEQESRFSLAAQQTVRGASAEGIREDFPLEGPRSLYGMTKLAAELMIQEYGEAFGIRYIINRCGVIAGPGQMGRTDQGVVTLWMACHYFGRGLNYIGFGGHGKQVRDILHVEDFCGMVAEQCVRFDQYSGGLFNLGGGSPLSVSLRELTALCQEITGKRIPIGSVPQNRPADVRIYISDDSRLRNLSGWKPSRSVKEILIDIYEWIQKEEASVKFTLLDS